MNCIVINENIEDLKSDLIEAFKEVSELALQTN